MSQSFRTVAAVAAIAMGFLVASSHAQAQPETRFPRVLNYSELMQLPEHKRVAYVKGLREALIEAGRISAKNKSRLVTESGAKSDWKAELALLGALIEEANAQRLNTQIDPGGQYQPNSPTQDPPKANSQARDTQTKIELADIKPAYLNGNASSGYTCGPTLKAIKLDSRNGRQGPEVYCGYDNPSASCPEGFIPVDQTNAATFKCASRASFAQLDQSDRESLRSVNDELVRTIIPKKLVYSEAAYKAFTSAKLPAAVPGASCGENEKRVQLFAKETRIDKAFACSDHEERQEFCRKGYFAADQDKYGRFFCISQSSYDALSPEDRQKAMTKNPDISTNPMWGTVNSEDARRRNSAFELGLPKAGDPNEKVKPISEGGAANGGECAAIKHECEDYSKDKKEEVRRAFWAKDLKCIYAGNISTYRSKDANSKRGTCVAPPDFLLNNGANGDANANKKEAGKNYWKCDKGQVICNPLIFGLGEDGKPVCRRPGGTATSDCSKASSPDNASKFLKSETPGVMERWNQFAKDISEICGDGGEDAKLSRAFHCEECKIIQERLLKTNLAVLGKCEMPSGQAPAAPSTAPATGNAGNSGSSGGSGGGAKAMGVK